MDTWLRVLIPLLLLIVLLKALELALRRRRSGRRPADSGARPYRLRGNFLSPAEHSFFLVLRNTVKEWAIVCPKVNLGDLFTSQAGDMRENLRAMNRIDRKHVDFVLCDARTASPLAGVELDDRSHLRADRQERDVLVQEVFDAAQLPLLRVPVQPAYNPRELQERLWVEARLGPEPATAVPRWAPTAAPPPAPRSRY